MRCVSLQIFDIHWVSIIGHANLPCTVFYNLPYENLDLQTKEVIYYTTILLKPLVIFFTVQYAKICTSEFHCKLLQHMRNGHKQRKRESLSNGKARNFTWQWL